MAQDNIQHGIDNNPTGDPEKGAALGGLGGVAVGAAAGSVAGPVGTVVGAIAGGLLGAGASGAAVAAVDAVDNDNTVSGVGHGVSTSGQVAHHSGTSATYAAPTAHNSGGDYETSPRAVGADASIGGHNVVTGEEAHSDAGKAGLGTGAIVGGLIGTAVAGPVGAVVGGALGSLTGGIAGDAAEAADDQSIAARNNYSGDAFRSGANANDGQVSTHRSVTDSFRNDENIGMNNIGAADLNADTNQVAVIGGVRSDSLPGNDIPGVQTGGATTRGSDTRGIAEKTADAITGDRYDDKTGGRVL